MRGTKYSEWYVADFETTSYNYYVKNGYTKVWLWAVCNSNAEVVAVGDNIETFIEWCKEHTNSIVYFHNLRFDGSFILNYIMPNYDYKDKLLKCDNKGISALIGNEGQWYQITLNFKSKKQIVFQDSLKIIPLKVKEIKEAFGTKDEKEKIDYEDYTINEKTISYISKDVMVVAEALKFFKDMGLEGMTIGAMAYHEWSKMCKLAKDLFPVLDEEFLITWRSAYRGGRAQVNPIHTNKILTGVKRFDINSMYPSVMHDYPMPYDYPIPIKQMGKYKFELYHVYIEFKLKDGHLPSLLMKSGRNNLGDTYYTNSDGVIELRISNIDYQIMLRHYDITYFELIDGVGFKTSTEIFKSFIDKFYTLKNNSTGGLKMVYKYILNNLYGKFGSNCKGRRKIPKLEDGQLRLETSDEEDLRKYYLPVAIAITSYSHLKLDDAIIIAGKYFVYCDTDSVHSLVDLPSYMCDNKKLGYFKLEGIEDKSKYLRQKCYMYKSGDKYVITCAGMPEELKEYLVKKYGEKTFDMFKLGLSINEETEGINQNDLKKRPMQVKGGVVLKPVPYTLRGVVA